MQCLLSSFEIRVMLDSQNMPASIPSTSIFWKSFCRISITSSLNFYWNSPVKSSEPRVFHVRCVLNHRLNFFTRYEAIWGSARDPPPVLVLKGPLRSHASASSLPSAPLRGGRGVSGAQRGCRFALVTEQAGGFRACVRMCEHECLWACECENICIPWGSLTGWPLDPGSPWLPGSPVPPAVPRLPGGPTCPGNPLSPLKKQNKTKHTKMTRGENGSRGGGGGG